MNITRRFPRKLPFEARVNRTRRSSAPSLWLSVFILLTLIRPASAQVQQPSAPFALARLQYDGGGDWYNGPGEIPNLLEFIRRHTTIRTVSDEARVEIMDESLFAYPMLYLTGHGNISLTDAEAGRLRTYLERGGFLFANDDYGLDRSFQREMARVFPDKRLVELPPAFGLFQTPFKFPKGLPKIHEHDGAPPQAFGIFHNGRLVLFYNFESDIGDGWDDPGVHNDPPEKRGAALRMGANVIVWALTH